MSPLKWLLSNQLKHSRVKQKVSGFTLIELLAAIILAFLIITPLLGFMISILDNDRKEQAKATTEQELKSALDYISRDLQQAVYIYDADGIKAIRSQLPKSAEKNNYFPVLVFWKRQYIKQGIEIKNQATTVGRDDTFVYSLVAYYLINDGNTTTWSNAARIGRFQLSDGYGLTAADKDSTRDTGFKLFNLSDEGTLKQKMNQWQNSGTAPTQDILPLVDYIDQNPIDSTKNPAPTCPSVPDPSSITIPPATIPMQIVPDFAGTTGGDSAPPTTINSLASPNVNIQGFYVCVDATRTVAEVHLRGNSLARLQSNNLVFDKNNDSTKSYYPQASTRVQGIGFLFTK